jgi:hypothetical protein
MKLKIPSIYPISVHQQFTEQMKWKSCDIKYCNLPDNFCPFCTFTAETRTDKMRPKCVMFPVLTHSCTSLYKQTHAKFNSLGSIVSHNFLNTDFIMFKMVLDSEIEADIDKKQCNQNTLQIM